MSVIVTSIRVLHCSSTSDPDFEISKFQVIHQQPSAFKLFSPCSTLLDFSSSSNWRNLLYSETLESTKAAWIQILCCFLDFPEWRLHFLWYSNTCLWSIFFGWPSSNELWMTSEDAHHQWKAGCNLKEQAWWKARDKSTTWTLEMEMTEVFPLSLWTLLSLIWGLSVHS